MRNCNGKVHGRNWILGNCLLRKVRFFLGVGGWGLRGEGHQWKGAPKGEGHTSLYVIQGEGHTPFPDFFNEDGQVAQKHW